MEYFNKKATLWQAPQTELRGPSMGYVWQTESGKYICIDSGIIPEADEFFKYLCENAVDGVSKKDGKIVVDGWFFTHAHSDHLGAFNEIIKKYGDKLEIKKIYFNFPPIEYLKKDVGGGSSQNDINLTEEFYSLIKGRNVVSDIKTDDEFLFDDVKIKVVFTFDLSIDVNHANNSSTVLKFYVGNSTVLFLGDLGKEGGTILMNGKNKADIKCDIVQMAHHGQRGVSEEFYITTGARVALWPTPKWLYNTPTEMHPFLHMDIERGWMKKLGTKNIVAMDGGIIIK